MPEPMKRDQVFLVVFILPTAGSQQLRYPTNLCKFEVLGTCGSSGRRSETARLVQYAGVRSAKRTLPFTTREPELTGRTYVGRVPRFLQRFINNESNHKTCALNQRHQPASLSAQNNSKFRFSNELDIFTKTHALSDNRKVFSVSSRKCSDTNLMGNHFSVAGFKRKNGGKFSRTCFCYKTGLCLGFCLQFVHS